jgi:hypothetical protein
MLKNLKEKGKKIIINIEMKLFYLLNKKRHGIDNYNKLRNYINNAVEKGEEAGSITILP